MINIGDLAAISVGAVLINNIVLVRCLGLCPFFGVSTRLSSATGMGLTVTAIMTLSSMCAWAIDRFILIRFHVEYLQTLIFVVVIAGMVQFLEMAVRKVAPVIHEALGIYLPLVTANCAILGVALITAGVNQYTGRPYTFVESVVNGVMSGAGFLVVLTIMAGIRERLDLAEIPGIFKGMPGTLIAAGLIALAFLGFSGLHFF